MLALRAAGAVLLGKTATAELGCARPAPTRHPLDGDCSPGAGAGPAAVAVATGMAAAALVSECDGTIAPAAAWCGVFAYRPSRGWIPRTGMLRRSRLLDHAGVLGSSVEDLALTAGALLGHDPGGPDSRAMARPALARTCRERPPFPPRFAVLTAIPGLAEPEPVMTEALGELRALLGEQAGEIGLGERFAALWALLGMPAVTLPLFEGPSGLPMGAQLVGLRQDDARLLRTGRWLCLRAAGMDEEETTA